MSESLKDRLAARRKELQAERIYVVPVYGYEDLGICARYRSLPYERLRTIGVRHENVKNAAEREQLQFADTLVTACVELLERTGEGEYRSLGTKWSPAAASEVFGVEDLPEQATAREAIRAVLPGTELAMHFREYDELSSVVASQVSEEMAGEFEPSTEG